MATRRAGEASVVSPKFRNYLAIITDVTQSDEGRLKAVQELSENFESIVTSSQYSAFLEIAVSRFIAVLRNGDPQFVAESHSQQFRKSLLEIVHRIPANDALRPHVKSILNLMFYLLEVENEENVLVCLRVIIELHKQFRPPFQPEIQQFLQFVKTMYHELASIMKMQFEGRGNVTVKSEHGGPPLVLPVKETLPGQTGILKATRSLKVLAELPIIVVLMYQLYKQQVHSTVAEFIPLIINTVILSPSSWRTSNDQNKELYVDFVAAQIKTLSLLAYVIRIYQDIVKTFAQTMVTGMLNLLRNCQPEVAHLRKELLIAARHILATDFRNHFITHVDKLFDEDTLVGTGWTTRESLRPLAYSTLADLVHHVRTHLSLQQLSLAVDLFAKNIHDETLPVSIQTISCKLLLNLVDCIRQKSDSDGNGRDILIRMLEVFAQKFETLAKYQIPAIFSKCVRQNADGTIPETEKLPAGVTGGLITPVATTPTASIASGIVRQAVSTVTVGHTSSSSGSLLGSTLSVGDCRGMVKTLVCGVKTITWGAGSCKAPGGHQQKAFFPKETPIFVRLLTYTLQCLDIYQVTVAPNGTMYLRAASCQAVRLKEEKENLEHFAGVFTMMHLTAFKEVFNNMIHYLVDRIQKNYALQIIPNTFLANPNTSAAFATILVSFLLSKMADMGVEVERSNLYLKLFKLVFGSVSLFAQENEQMLKPHLHDIVTKSMELAQSAKEPYNYFLLLRALFRSIGGGSHDLLYQEFLPLLPRLLQGLNRLQGSLHKQHMKDLFVELCLTVPVRLSSLLPYLPMLMDPLVSALNGSQPLISQGLRTLELCVDNLQPDFLYDHIQPVRAELMQALWRQLRNPLDNIAQVAFRVLGKFGGGNRKMLCEPQKMTFKQESSGLCVSLQFLESSRHVLLPIDKIVEQSVMYLKQSSASIHIKKQAWNIIKAFLIASMNLSDTEQTLYDHLCSVSTFVQQSTEQHSRRKASIVEAALYQNCIEGLFAAASLKDLQSDAAPFMEQFVFHITLLLLTEKYGLQTVDGTVLNGTVLMDALANSMGSEEKELSKVAEKALGFLTDTAVSILGSSKAMYRLPLMKLLVDKLVANCYERAWYTKAGGCQAISWFLDKMSLTWILEHQLKFISALLFVMMDLTEEVSYGTVSVAKDLLEKLLSVCNVPLEGEAMAEARTFQAKIFPQVVEHFVQESRALNKTVREQAHHSLGTLASMTGKTVTEIMDPYRAILADAIPPKKHLLRHQPVNTQLGIIDGFTFCTTLKPRLFSINNTIQEHQTFYQELLAICDLDDASLSHLSCYKGVPSLIPLRKSAMAALAACNYIEGYRKPIFDVLRKLLDSDNQELAAAAEVSMKKFLEGQQLDVEQAHASLRPLLSMLSDYRHLSLQFTNKLSRLMRLFPTSFNEKLCETLLSHLKKWMDAATVAVNSKPVARDGELQEVKICTAILDTFHLVPASSAKLLEPLISLVLSGERALMLEIGSPFRDPLFKFMCCHPGQVVEYFMSHLAESHTNRLFTFLLQRKDAGTLRSVLEKQPGRLVSTAFNTVDSNKSSELQYQGILITRCLVKFNEYWLTKPKQKELVIALRELWTSKEFQQKAGKNTQSGLHWKEPKYLVKCLLNYVKHHRDDVELLFQLLRVFTSRYMPSFHFLKEFLDQEVAQGYTVSERRQIFFKFVELFWESSFPDEVKAKALQCILIPVFTTSFARGHKEQLLGDPPNPDQDHHNDLVSVFIEKVIDSDRPLAAPDALRIMLLQFSALLVDQASEYVHDPTNKTQKQGSKLRRLTAYAWPCLLNKQCEDPATRYHGHLLLAHIIAKFAINKKIVLQVFHSLLRAHAVEARGVIRQALEVLTPAIPARTDDGNTVLMHWTKKIIVEEGHTVAQLVHILQLVVRHYKVYYPVRGYLIQYMASFMQKLGFPPNATIEHRRLAVDLAEVIIKWEMQRIKSDNEVQTEQTVGSDSSTSVTGSRASSPAQAIGVKRPSEELSQDSKRLKTVAGVHARQLTVATRHVLEKQHQDAVVNFLIRIACQVNESNATAGSGSPGEVLSRRCVALLKTALRPDIWPVVDLKLTWFDKLLSSVTAQSNTQQEQSTQVNYPNICTALEILTLLLSVVNRPSILPMFKPLQRGIIACMSSHNTKVIRGVHNLLAKLMSLFPTDSTSSSVSKYEELEGLYSSVIRIIHDGLQTYERSTTTSSTTTMGLYGTLMILKAACSHNACYIDRFLSLFMKTLSKMQHDHLLCTEETAGPVLRGQTPNEESLQVNVFEVVSAKESLKLCAALCKLLGFELVKMRLPVMPQEMRKNFITLLANLIEKSSEVRLLRAVTKIVEEWVKQKTQLPVQQTASLKEKSLLLHRMMTSYEKRFPNEQELNAQFLDLVNYVYKEESLRGSELTSKLEPAFLAGLRCNQPQVRAKFFQVLDYHLPRQLCERLLYIVQTQNWEFIGPHFWIKQCIELLLTVADCDQPVKMVSETTALPFVSSLSHIGGKSFGLNNPLSQEEETVSQSEKMEVDLPASRNQLKLLSTRHAKFIAAARSVKTASVVDGIVQLCHEDTSLAFHMWLELFPRIWSLLSEHQQQMLSGEISPFLCSGAHLTQVDCHPSAIEAFLEAFLRCKPTIFLRPFVLKYLGKAHNAWHRACLCLEEHAFDCDDLSTELQADAQLQHKQLRERIISEHRISNEDLFGTRRDETLDCLSELYSELKEEDMWAGLWHKRCRFPETSRAVFLEQHGLFEQAQTKYEEVMGIAREEHNHGPAHPAAQPEYRLWQDHWIRCCKELGQWNLLTELGRNRLQPDPYLVLDSAWKLPDWSAMKDALSQVELNSPESLAYKLSLYRGYLALCPPEEQHFTAVTKLVEAASNQAIKQWKRLPSIVSSVHITFLQAAQQIMELQEATQIRTGLQPTSIGRTASLHDMKAIVKTWRNRLPNQWDDLSHWSDIFMWRQHHYQAIVSAYEQHSPPEMNHAMLGVHASAWAIIHHARIARKQDLISVCLDNLSRIYTIPSVPIVDCFQKIRQQVKCYLQSSLTLGKGELQEGLDLIESTNMKPFQKEMVAEFFALKGLFYSQMEKSEDANKAFSAAVQLSDSLSEAWGLWGDYLDQIFIKDRNRDVGIDAMTCYLHACRHNDEVKGHKILARVLWLLSFDDETRALSDVIDKYGVGVPPNHWLPWIPQLLSLLVRRDGRQILNLLYTIGRAFPQAIYFPTRTIYLALKIERKENVKSEKSTSQHSPISANSLQNIPIVSAVQSSSTETLSDFTEKPVISKKEDVEPMDVDSNKETFISGITEQEIGEPMLLIEGIVPGLTSMSSSRFSFESSGEPMSSASDGQVKATPEMWRCSRIMHRLRELHPTLLCALEAIVDQLIWFRENWVEDVLRQLQQALRKCYLIAFETRDDVSGAEVPAEMQMFLQKLVSCFDLGFETSSDVSATLSSVASETFARCAQATMRDPVFQQLKEKFSQDFNCSHSTGLHGLVDKLKKWINILQERVAAQPKSFLLEERCRFLNNFSMSTAEIELPGEVHLPKPLSYCVKIARFLPKVEVVKKYGVSARRLCIRGHNGVLYPYLVISDNNYTESKREDSVFQLCRVLNVYAGKRKETCRRNLLFYIPRYVFVSPQIRLIEDNPTSVSLESILEQHCSSRGSNCSEPVTYYYERHSYLQQRGRPVTQELLENIFSEIQSSLVPKLVLKKWAVCTYQDAVHYWTFRKQFTVQLAVAAFLEYVMHLTALTPAMLYIARDTGQLLFSGFKFDITASDKLNGRKPVPFRVTPNIAEFLGQIGVAGLFTASIIAAARCAVQPSLNFVAVLKTVISDEFLMRKRMGGCDSDQGLVDVSEAINNVDQAASSILARLEVIATLEGSPNPVDALVANASSAESLCQMDPAWYPWL